MLLVLLPNGLNCKPSWKWRFTFVSPFRSEYWTTIARGIQDASREAGANTIETGPIGEVNADIQIQAIETAIAAKVDGIITMALDPKQFTNVIDKAADSGIPVVLVDTDAPHSRRSAYIGTDNFAAGEEAARIMIQAIGSKAEIGIITGPVEADNQKLRIRGFREGISSSPNLRIVDTQVGNSDFLMEGERVQTMLSEHPGISALFGADGYGSLASAIVVKQLGRVGRITIIGFDVSAEVAKNIQSNIVHAVLVQDNYQMGYQAIRVLAGIKAGRMPPSQVIYTGIRILTAKEIAAYSLAAGWSDRP
jgi:ribose transport system substrate-binding protein